MGWVPPSRRDGKWDDKEKKRQSVALVADGKARIGKRRGGWVDECWKGRDREPPVVKRRKTL